MIKTSTKILLAVAGILLIVLGIVCIANPAATLFSTAWMIGCLTLVSGIAELIFTFKTQAFLPNSGTRMLSSILQILLGIIFLGHNLFVTISLPIIFASWVLIEGIILAVQSFCAASWYRRCRPRLPGSQESGCSRHRTLLDHRPGYYLCRRSLPVGPLRHQPGRESPEAVPCQR